MDSGWGKLGAYGERDDMVDKRVERGGQVKWGQLDWENIKDI